MKHQFTKSTNQINTHLLIAELLNKGYQSIQIVKDQYREVYTVTANK